MELSRFQQAIASLLLALVLVVSGCAAEQPSRWDDVQQSTSQPAVVEDATAGGQFNRFFPSAEGDYDRVFIQEKQGFAQASLKQGGEEVALLSVSDTSSTPAAAQKFAKTSSTIAGYPSVRVGDTQTAVLVGDRYQVKVISKADDFSASDREAWLEKFDLAGLDALQ